MSQHASHNEAQLYRLVRRVSGNALAESWIARRRQGGVLCFVKTINAESNLAAALQDAILSESLRCQAELRHPRIVTAVGRARQNGRLTVEYPYLDPAYFKPLDDSTFSRRAAEVLPEIAVLVDYIHHLDLVHCDLKLENFLIGEGPVDRAVRLVDLDFLCPVGSRPNAKVFGTPDHIAPEILSNDRVYRQSDIYSLGISLGRCLEGNLSVGAEVRGALEDLVAQMTHEDPLLRPRSLVVALGKAGLIDAATQTGLNRRLLSMLLLTHFLKTNRPTLGEASRLEAFLADVKILGVDPGMANLFARAYQIDRRAAFSVFRELVIGSDFQQAADYWSTATPDEILLKLFARLGETAGRGLQAPAGKGGNGSPAGEPAATRVLAEQLTSEGQRLWGYLLLKEAAAAAERAADAAPEDLAAAWQVLAESAVALSRLHESAVARLRMAELLPPDDWRGFDARYQAARLYYALAQPAEAEEILGVLLAEASERGDLTREIQVRRLLAMLQTDFRQGCDVGDLVRRTITDVQGVLEPSELAVSYYVAATVAHRQGRFQEVREYLNRAIELVRTPGHSDRLLLFLPALSIVYTELGEHLRSRHYALVGLRLARKTGESFVSAMLMIGLAGVCGRLGYIDEAEYWESRVRSLLRQENDLGALQKLAGGLGYSHLQRGDLRGGKEILLDGIQMMNPKLVRFDLAKTYHNLAECALWQGEANLCDSYVALAKPILREMRDRVGELEVELFEVLNRIYNREVDDLSDLRALLEPLVAHRSAYVAMVCAYHLLLRDDAGRAGVIRQIEPIRHVLADSPTPLFRALRGLLPVWEQQEIDRRVLLKELKEAFRVFLRGEQKFLAVVTGWKIGEMYLAESSFALGQKYLAQGLKLGEALDNHHLQTILRERIAAVRGSADSRQRLVHSMHGISLVLRNMSDYEEALNRLVEFAVNETGAERGAMLLRSPHNRELYVAAYFNCDEGSLGDITDISSTVPLDASRQLKPLIIDDATSDERTREYQSVIRHNILSVICIPIVPDGETVGALYLDHHTIPALFEEDDITYIQAIANFMAMALSTLRQYRSVNIINRELLASLNRPDDGGAFVTGDPATLQMLQPLGEIALSDRPVLILGESGTGKDVLARKIHGLSRRAGKPFVHFNCSSVPEPMMESELFGVARGAATGVAEREGKFAAADGGTLFFDEIGDMAPSMQAKILVAVDKQQFERVGSNRSVWVDCRFIYATNRELAAMVERQEFRLDLYQRMNFFTIEIPPLRERPTDIPLLIDYFLRSMCREQPAPRFSRAVTEVLLAYRWPGNVRELRNLVERFCLIHPGQEIGVSMLPRDIQSVRSTGPYGREVSATIERQKMREVLAANDGNVSRAARAMGIPLTTFRRRAKKSGLI